MSKIPSSRRRGIGREIHRRLLHAAAVALLASSAGANASMGHATIPAEGDRGRITLFYPTTIAEQAVQRGPFALNLAPDAPVAAGNRRLIVISHGSGGSPWVFADVARALVDAGFVVALPAHRGDHSGDDGTPGPESWTIRPREVSRAIDAVAGDVRFAPKLDLDRVGMYGMSAGGHTALSLAGGRWSPAGFAHHCEVHIADDFQTCVGLISRLTGSAFDGVREWIALMVIRLRFADDTPRVDGDPRIAAIIAAVPLAADFDADSLVHPTVPLGLITARHDRWLIPRFHGDRVLELCRSCEHVADVADGGHGALLSPLPPGLTGLVGDLLNDPPGFDRAASTAMIDHGIVAFFVKHLLTGPR